MATAGGAKMEPASCVKQSSSRSALRCLRYVPPWERHSAERGEEVGRARGRDVTSARRAASRNPEVSGMSFISSDEVFEVTCYPAYSLVCQFSHLKRLLKYLPASRQRCFLSLRGTPDSVLKTEGLFRTSRGQSFCGHHFLHSVQDVLSNLVLEAYRKAAQDAMSSLVTKAY